MKDKAKKFAGPTKKMMKALEDEGLYVDWPKVVRDVHDLAIEGTFTTGNEWEKLVLIDLRDEGDLSTKAKVDAAISNQLDDEYENFCIWDELKLNMEGTEEERIARGVPDAARLLEDMQEQDARLKRFADVAHAVAEGRKIPEEEDEEEITLSKKDARTIVELLGNLDDLLMCATGKSRPELKEVIGVVKSLIGCK